MSQSQSQSGSSGPGSGAQNRIELAIRICSLIYALACLMYLAWVMIPAHQRKQWAMKTAAALQNAAARAAFRTGHQAMGQEISGRGENYALPYALNLAAAQAGRAYRKLRYTT